MHGCFDSPAHARRAHLDSLLVSPTPAAGRVLEVHTTKPGLRLYTGNKLNGSVAGRGGIIYRQSAGFALEPRGFPDAPHHPNFPSIILRLGESCYAVICYRFTTE